MSTTAIVWLIAFVYLALKGLQRPIYPCCGYLMTFFLAPPFWWWGRGALTSITLRWNLIGAILIVVSVLIHWHRKPPMRKSDSFFLFLLFLYTANCYLVHNLLADYPRESYEQFDLVWKSCTLALFLRLSIWETKDLQILMYAILILCAYVGYEVVVNDQGTIVKGRLEGINFPGASGSNGTSAIVSISLPLVAYFVIANPFPYSRIVAFISAPLILDTLLRCNSRGAYLGAAVGGIALFLLSSGSSRKYAALMVVGGVIAFFVQAQDPKIWNRLFSIGAKEEERDNSALERIEYWKAGWEMIRDYPLGSGGRAAFVSPRGMSYIRHIRQDEFRSVHNGYLSIMAGWGMQGLAIYLIAIAIALITLWLAIRRLSAVEYDTEIFLGACIFASLVSQLVCTNFGDYLDGEWFLWFAVLGLAYPQTISLSSSEKNTNLSSLDEIPLASGRP